VLELAPGHRALLPAQLIWTEWYFRINPTTVRQGLQAARDGFWKVGVESIGMEITQRANVFLESAPRCRGDFVCDLG